MRVQRGFLASHPLRFFDVADVVVRHRRTCHVDGVDARSPGLSARPVARAVVQGEKTGRLRLRTLLPVGVYGVSPLALSSLGWGKPVALLLQVRCVVFSGQVRPPTRLHPSAFSAFDGANPPRVRPELRVPLLVLRGVPAVLVSA